MKIVSMSGSLRENVGKKDAKALRRQDRVPCVMYGKTEQVLFSVPQVEFKPLVFSPDAAYIYIGDSEPDILKPQLTLTESSIFAFFAVRISGSESPM